MYAWMWRRLPGARWVKALWTLTGFGLAVFLLFQYVFPWLEPHLPLAGNGSFGH